MRRKIWYVLLCFAASGLLVFLGADAQNAGPGPALTPAIQKHLKEIAESLPPDSGLRYGLEHGGHGDGVHFPWMNEMRQQGIRRAVVRTEFVWHKKPTDIKVTRLVYFSTYDGDCGQITDPQRLSKIRSSGLEAELSEEALRRTLGAPWFRTGPPRRNKRGWCLVDLLDDEWLPPSPPDSLILMPKSVDPLAEAAGMGDVASITALLHSGVTAQRRNGLVWALTGVPSPCTLKALLRAGADPNMRDRDGSPLLMEEIRRGNVENAKVLVEAGADVNAKNAYGFTILSMAEAKPEFPGQDELVRLLKADGARN
jgi:hypothetical protein